MISCNGSEMYSNLYHMYSYGLCIFKSCRQKHVYGSDVDHKVRNCKNETNRKYGGHFVAAILQWPSCGGHLAAAILDNDDYVETTFIDD